MRPEIPKWKDYHGKNLLLIKSFKSAEIGENIITDQKLRFVLFHDNETMQGESLP